MSIKGLIFMVCIGAFFSCSKSQKSYPKLEMTADEIVNAIVQMYTVSAAINVNDEKYRDSTSAVYYQQVAKLTGKSIEVIKSDFEKLELMQDSLLILQNRAMDTLRMMQERNLQSPNGFIK